MMKRLALSLLLSLAAFGQKPIDQYNVLWTSPSKDFSGSMPLGNGDIGVNAWVEPSGDLVFYISKTDSWSETVRLLKIGRVRVRISPNPLSNGGSFRQTLKLSTGEFQVTGGKTDNAASISLWVDANAPVIHVVVDTTQRSDIQVIYERWRDQQRFIEGDEAHSAYGLNGGPGQIVSYGDSLALDSENRIVWYHRNARSAFPEIMKLQGMTDFGFPDPILNRTFGAGISGEGLTKMNATALRSAERRTRHVIAVDVLTMQADSPDQFVSELNNQISRHATSSLVTLKQAHDEWWDAFWNRSWLRASGGKPQTTVSQGYALQRYINACAGRGAYPIKFNGSIFTVDAKVGDSTFDADYRKWGGPYWFQNTRHIYWPMLAAGDHDLMLPFFRMYTEASMMASRRTKLYFNHDGLFLPETMYFWGAYTNKDYGWKRAGKPLSYVENPYIRYYYSNTLELVQMALDYSLYTGNKEFLRTTVVPLAEGIINFYDKHYERQPGGKMRIAPAQSLETWQDAVNPLPDVAGLKFVITNLFNQKVPIGRNAQNAARRILQSLPDIPVKEVNGKTMLAPAEKTFGEPKNTENPELYAVFPYRLYGVLKPDSEAALAAFEARRIKRTGGWTPDAIQAAYLGLTSEARDAVVQNFSTKDPDSRFPAFWGPNFDWTPDQDHGNVAMMALQTMLMQCEGNRIVLLPAWPKDWDVEFKLRAPQNTTVEGSYRGGKLEYRVTPERRAADVVRGDGRSQ